MQTSIQIKQTGRCLDRLAAYAMCAMLAGMGQAHAASDPTRFSLEELMNLTVVGGAKYDQHQSDVAAATSVITREEIKVFGWKTLNQALASLPGMHTTYDRQYDYIGTRGFGLPGDYNTRVLVMINGNRINDPIYDQGPVGWEFPLDLNLVERIEFMPGPGSAVYGQNAMLGVVNVITRDGANLHGGRASLEWEQPQRASETSLTYGRKLDNGVDVLLAASARNSRGEDLWMDFGTAGDAGLVRGLDGESVRRLFTRLNGNDWSVDVMQGERTKNDPTASFGTDPRVAGQYSGDRYTLANFQYQASCFDDQVQFTGRLFAGSYRFRSWLSYLTERNSQYEMPGMSDWHGVELRWVTSDLSRHKLMVGLEHQDNARAVQYIRDLVNPANDISIQSSGRRTGVYVQDEWKLGTDLTAIYGIRFDASSGFAAKSSPRVGLIWKPSEATTLKGLLGRAYRNPNAYERDFADGIWTTSNPGLRGESIDTEELVADHRLDVDTRLRASVYQWRIDDVVKLDNDPVSQLQQYQSGPNLRTKGLELSADHTWRDGSRMRGSWSLQQSRYADGSSVLNAPARLFKLLASTPLPAYRANLGFEWYYDSPRLTLDGTRLGGYSVSNLYVRWETGFRGWEFGLGLVNLLDKHYMQPASDSNWQNALAQDGRSVSLQASYRFE